MSTALYRRYRPDTFAEVIGQEHVTEPLMAALERDRVNHAYLFSGPRGCGKTTSARILARCLNCAKGPTGTPCGECESCQDLANGGAGSLDVVEIDAASHNGVDDARDIRERAVFAPARDRYKIFILDEAHMVTTQGFNALLKLVEEPPDHVKFIFATTEPDKVIGTIRSRTHHYPFRLVPPERLTAYLAELCEREDVPVGKGVLPLVVRAGGGSVRDTLSVLDQLMAGAGNEGVDYERAVALLGYTHASLLDDVTDAFAAGDGATVFRVVDRVIESGHDPRRFVEDLLERFRDLIVVAAAPESAQAILRGVPSDQLERMAMQARHFGRGELSRAADVVNSGLTEMTGATSPRLQLELICARVLLPGSDETERGTRARVDRIERRFGVTPTGTMEPGFQPPEPVQQAAPSREHAPVSSPAASVATPVPPMATAESTGAQPTTAEPAAARSTPAESAASGIVAVTDGDDGSTGAPNDGQASRAGAASPLDEQRQEQESGWPAPSGGTPATSGVDQANPQQVTPQQTSPQGAGSGADNTVEVIRRAWAEILEALTKIRKFSWILVSQNAQVHSFGDGVLTLTFATAGLANTFNSGPHPDYVSQAVNQAVGIACKVTGTADDGAAQSAPQYTDSASGSGGFSGAADPGSAQPAEAARSWNATRPAVEEASGSEPDHPSAAAGPIGGRDVPADSSMSVAGRRSADGDAGRNQDAGRSQTDGDTGRAPARSISAPVRDSLDSTYGRVNTGSTAPDWDDDANPEPRQQPRAEPGPEERAGSAESDTSAAATSAASAEPADQEVPDEPAGWEVSAEPAGWEVPAEPAGWEVPAEPAGWEVPAEPADETESVPASQTQTMRQSALERARARLDAEGPAATNVVYPNFGGPSPQVPAPVEIDDMPSADDPDQEHSGMMGRAVVEKLLGGVVIDEIED
ncbi:DNA polymerase III subunit gamma and tau [Saxibacter everestensis]|uniref:DNA-directed DNA polymerase n=1 Tax=Saxibacter everestensis TaxID=2909229 RepID=A0ABY8QQ29_9MICO|nr:DNA polymerase III subunit gamma and tau [Brevibacteriaceae bacterium ZFBP1038]